MIRKLRYISLCGIFTLAIMLCFTRCGVYSFSGASIHPSAKTVSVAYFQSMAPLAINTLSNTFTNALKEKFTRSTKLVLAQSEGDFAFEGEITGYTVSPVAISGNEYATKQRLTITVKVRFTNRYKKEDDFDKSFSRYEEYDSSSNLASVERGLVDKIVEQLVDDIFNESAAKW